MYTINQQQINDFHHHGFCLVPHFFDEADIALMRLELQRLRDLQMLANKCTSGDGCTPDSNKINLQICPLTPHSDIFRSLPFFQPVGDSVAQLIHPPFVLQLDQIFVKPAGTGYGTNWHQDNAYFHSAQTEPHRGVGMWIAIDDTKKENGTMHLIPNSHRTLKSHRRDLHSDHFITCADAIDESEAVAVELKAGGVAFFNFGVVHCTKNNTSNGDRAGLALHFAESAIESPHHDLKHPLIRGSEASHGHREFGIDLRHAWQVTRDQRCGQLQH